jgi:DNA-binding FrmR family transcriptional regulator
MDEKNCCCARTTERSAEEYKKLMNRLSRIEGQIRGIRGMVERSAYCPDILVQSAAVAAAINAFNRELLSSHIRACVTGTSGRGTTRWWTSWWTPCRS